MHAAVGPEPGVAGGDRTVIVLDGTVEDEDQLVAVVSMAGNGGAGGVAHQHRPPVGGGVAPQLALEHPGSGLDLLDVRQR